MGDIALQIQVTEDVDISSNPKRQCWACVKKRLVCDYTRPACKKCKSAGIDCPGYNQKKPLKWLETGKVTSRKPPTRQGAAGISRKGMKNTSTSVTCVSAARNAAIVPIASRGDWRSMAGLLAFSNDGSSTTIGVEVGAVGSKKKGVRDGKMDVLFETGTYAVSAEALYCSDADLLPRIFLRDETAEIVQAVQFYNDRSYPMMLENHKMAPSPLIISFTPTALHQLPAAINHAMVAFALGYKMHRHELPSKDVWSKVYHHRGLAIRDLSQRIQSCCTDGKITNVRQENVADVTIASIFVFLCSELQQCASPNWRYHTDAMARLIKLRGGLKALWQKSLPLRSSLIHFIIIATFANATSPASDHISIAPHNELLEMLNEMYDEVFSYCLCPSTLFKEIVSINYLRSQASNGSIDITTGQTMASEIFRRIESFSSSDWAAKREGFTTEINLIGSIYHSAVMLYCILSLEHLHLLDPTILTPPLRHKYTVRLTAAIRAGLEWPRVKFFITWPIVVLGVEVAEHGPQMQDWVDGLLVGMSREFGTCSPLVARSALRKFWKEKKTKWDECFDIPHAFCC